MSASNGEQCPRPGGHRCPARLEKTAPPAEIPIYFSWDIRSSPAPHLPVLGGP